MTDIEGLLEKAQQLKGRENCIRWELAEIAYEIVGSPLGRAGATRQLADVCGLSAVDAVEHWAKAYRLYRVMFRYESEADNKYSDWFMGVLSVSHFYTMWELGHKHRLKIWEIFNYFYTLIGHKISGHSWSVAALKAEVGADYPSGNVVNWRWHWDRLERNIDALLTFGGELPVAVRALARMYKGMKR